ncbi:MAG: TIGR00159 family protein, partial [Chloroflexota bacterium]
ERKYGGLIVFSRLDSLQAYIDTGVILKAEVTPETLIQIFYPKTPLHDGAVIVANEVIAAAGCVLPLSASGVLEESPERSMGLRHRAALGIAEETDAVAVVISEETGIVSLAYEGKLDKYVPLDELQAKLAGFFLPEEDHRSLLSRLVTLFQGFVE